MKCGRYGSFSWLSLRNRVIKSDQQMMMKRRISAIGKAVLQPGVAPPCAWNVAVSLRQTLSIFATQFASGAGPPFPSTAVNGDFAGRGVKIEPGGLAHFRSTPGVHALSSNQFL